MKCLISENFQRSSYYIRRLLFKKFSNFEHTFGSSDSKKFSDQVFSKYKSLGFFTKEKKINNKDMTDDSEKIL